MSKNQSERGATLVMVALMLMFLFTLVALVVDVGAGYVERRRLQSVADAAALAAVQVLTSNGTDQEINDAVQQYGLIENPVGSRETRDVVVVQWMVGATPRGTVGLDPRPTDLTGILVTMKGSSPAFFASVLGVDRVNAGASGAGGYVPLDVVLVLDRSGSMDDDSCMLHDAASGFNLREYIIGGGPCDTGDYRSDRYRAG